MLVRDSGIVVGGHKGGGRSVCESAHVLGWLGVFGNTWAKIKLDEVSNAPTLLS